VLPLKNSIRRRQLQRQLVSHGEFPDRQTGSEPDGRPARLALNSGMSAISESVSPALASFEAKWEGVFIVAGRPNPAESAPSWRPPVNAYRCSDQFIIYVDLAGVPAESIEVLTDPGRVVIRGRRPAPEPVCLRSEPAQLLALEIDQGSFERVLDLPQPIDPRGITTEYNEGLLQIRLPLSS